MMIFNTHQALRRSDTIRGRSQRKQNTGLLPKFYTGNSFLSCHVCPEYISSCLVASRATESRIKHKYGREFENCCCEVCWRLHNIHPKEAETSRCILVLYLVDRRRAVSLLLPCRNVSIQFVLVWLYFLCWQFCVRRYVVCISIFCLQQIARASTISFLNYLSACSWAILDAIAGSNVYYPPPPRELPFPQLTCSLEYRWTRSQGRPAPRFCKTTRSNAMV